MTAIRQTATMGLRQGLTEQELAHHYRRDRAELLSFVLTAGLLKKVVMPPGVASLEDVDLDQVSVKYVLNCARKGHVLELLEAVRRFQNDVANLSSPAGFVPLGENHTCDGVGGVDQSCSIPVDESANGQLVSEEISCISISTTQQGAGENCVFQSKQENIDKLNHIESEQNLIEPTDLILDLPSFATGLTSDDLRETAYEVLLASVGGAGGLISPAKEKTYHVSPLPKVVKNRVASMMIRAPGLAGLLETMRLQMKISEEADTRTREALLRAAAAGRVGKRMDTLLVPLELLCMVTAEDFPDTSLFLDWKRRQLYVLEEGLVNHSYARNDLSDRLGSELRLLIGRFEQSQMFLLGPTAQAHYAESLKSLRTVATALAKGVGNSEHSGELCHWADGYYLNVQLYEMLLGSIYDQSNPSQLLEEVEEILELLKSTWRVLGVTQTVHDTCYTWVLFQQFVLTGEASLLQQATQQMKRIASGGQRGIEERSYMKTLCCRHGSEVLTYVQAVLMPTKLWADKRLENYHAHFMRDLPMMDDLLSIAMTASRLIADEGDQTGVNKLSIATDTVAAAKQVKDYICSSVALAFEHVLEFVDLAWESQNEHPLALLGAQVIELARMDASLFVPVLARWHPQAQAVSASALHNLYYRELKPFLERVSDLTDDVTSVLPMADKLEKYLGQLVHCVAEGTDSFTKEMPPYQVEVVSSNLILGWINDQLKNISELIKQAVAKEEWERKQCFGNSVNQFSQLLQELVNRFFDLKLPMRVPVLRSLVNGLDGAVQLYADEIVKQLGNVTDLIPPLPVLTRYKKDTIVKAFSKKKSVETKVLHEKRLGEINLLTISRLCAFLNTLHELGCKADIIEENIKKRWSTMHSTELQTASIFFPDGRSPSDLGDSRSKSFSRSSEEFSIGFDTSRGAIKYSIDKCCEFAGMKIVFWDMRESFVDGLYKMAVSQARIGKIVTKLEAVLLQLCESVVEPLRDQVVLSLFQASLDGLMWVLLDGGHSRCFSQNDVDILVEDLNVLKSFFIADGDGLPKSLVDSAAAPVQQVIDLYKVETWILIENFKHANNECGGGEGNKYGQRILSDMEKLLRVLCHRPDREASKFLKKQFKLP